MIELLLSLCIGGGMLVLGPSAVIALMWILIKSTRTGSSFSLLCNRCRYIGKGWKADGHGPIGNDLRYQQRYLCPRCGQVRVVKMRYSELGSSRV